ncbi:MAG: sugar transferase [Acidimicrobiales bacterium]
MGGNDSGRRQGEWLLPTLDALSLTIVWGIALIATNITIEDARSDLRSSVILVVVVAMTLTIFKRSGLYVSRPALPRTEEISRVLTGIMSGAAAGVVFVAFTDWRIGAWEVVLGVAGALATVVVARGLLRNLGELLTGHHQPARVVIVGTGIEAREVAEVINDHRESRLHLVGVIGHLPVAEESGLADLWIGPTSRLIELMHIHEATGAIVTPTGFRSEQFRSITSSLFNAGFDVHLSSGVSRLNEGRYGVRTLAHEPLIVMESREIPSWQLAVKRVIDVVLASVALVLFSPIMLLTMLAIKLEDRGPVFFRQRRAGRNSERFGMYKFRSMVVNAEELKADLVADNERTGPLFKMTDDPRITRVGKAIRDLSVDELPQLLNVIKGDMSLVGPRPALVEEEEAFDDELRRRFSVRPGITGLWQAEARSNASFAAYRRLDLHYVENWTIGLDIRILLATAEQIVVAIAMVPVKALLRRRLGEAEVRSIGTDVIDLRDAATAKMAANAKQTVDSDRTDGGRSTPSDGSELGNSLSTR